MLYELLAPTQLAQRNTASSSLPSSGPQVGAWFQSEVKRKQGRVRGLLLHMGVVCLVRDGRKSGSGPALWVGLWIRGLKAGHGGH